MRFALTFGLVQADVQLHAECLQRLAGVARLALALLGQVALGVGLALAGLRVPMPQHPDHGQNRTQVGFTWCVGFTDPRGR